VAQNVIDLLMLLTVVSVAVVIIVYDIRHYIIPDFLTGLLFLLACLKIGVLFERGASLLSIGITIAAALGAVLFLYLLWAVSKGRWIGFGDVKLILPLGLLVGPTLVFSLVVYSFWIGAAVSLLLIGLGKLQRGKLRLHFKMHNLTIKSVVPFAPFLILSCLLILFTNYNVLDLFTFVN
jgi:prepilin signal peptidase PulO-like enzyme (type II secretory pathway)